MDYNIHSNVHIWFLSNIQRQKEGWKIMEGKEIANLIYEWANKEKIHPDDFDVLFAFELLAMLEQDEYVGIDIRK
jgi:hypothetical protein